MTDTVVHCPECGAEIPVSQVLQAQIRKDLEAEFQREQQRRVREAVETAEKRMRDQAALETRDLEARLREQQRLVEAARAEQQRLAERAERLAEREAALQKEVEKAVERRLEEALAKRLEQAMAEERSRSRLEQKALQERLAEQHRRLDEAQKAELALRKEKQRLEDQARELELEVQRRIDAEREKIEAAIRERLETQQGLKLKEKEQQIRKLQEALEDARRSSQLGSQELQGETLELEIQSVLEREFPRDLIEPVPKGMRGADIVQTVCNERGEDCGQIVWESKNTKAWQPAWIDKLKQDQRTLGAPIAVIVSVVLPGGIRGFGKRDGVWIADPRHWPALAAALREQLLQVAWARAASEGRDEKMALLYDYLAGDEFRQRVETIVEAFEAMRAQLEKERRAMTRHWAEREKQLQRVIGSTGAMYGALQGIVGGRLQSVPALEIEPEGLPELE